MEVKSKFFIAAVFCLMLSEMAIARLRLPLCKNQPDPVTDLPTIGEKESDKSVAKREFSSWPLSCLHASIIKDEKNEAFFSYQIFECCHYCEFPHFSLCTLAGYPDWLCGSEAYDCVFSCRDEHSVLEAVHEAHGSAKEREGRELKISESEAKSMKKTLRQLRRENECYKKTCTTDDDGNKQCCLTKTCIPVKKLQKLLRRKKNSRSKSKAKSVKTVQPNSAS